jgi:hypothetical protein
MKSSSPRRSAVQNTTEEVVILLPVCNGTTFLKNMYNNIHMHEGIQNEAIPPWDPHGSVPPPMTPEYGYTDFPEETDEDGASRRTLPPSPPPGAFGDLPAPLIDVAPVPTERTWLGKELGFPPPPPLPPGASLPPPPPIYVPESEPRIIYEGSSELQERRIEQSTPLTEREASKQFLSEERQRLAEEIRAARRTSRDKIAELSARTEIEGMFPIEAEKDIERMAANYDTLTDVRAGEANGIVERLSESGQEMLEEDVKEERENIKQLVDNDDKLKALREKLAEHYARADEIGKEKIETIQKSVEQALIRNNAFLVHTLTTHEELRHNTNSNIIGRATLEDDIDLLLSLEPSISTSSVTPGVKTSLFQEEFGNIGVILGGGDIEGATHTDAGSISTGIKRRRIIGENDVSVEKIDEVIGQRKDGDGYNEIVVNNPKVFGMFRSAHVGELGEMSGDPQAFEEFVMIAKQKGIPPYVMIPDRRIFEFISINNEGEITVGNEITPEQVATGKAGLSPEKRKEIGGEILQKHLFRDVNTQQEAKAIVASLSGEGTGEVRLSNAEYLAQLKNNPTEIRSQLPHFPETLRGDKQFMLESAKIDPVSTYEYASAELRNDRDFVSQVYASRDSNSSRYLYSSLPVELQKDPEIALLAIENNDDGDIDADMAEIPEVWNKLVENKVNQTRLPELFSRDVGEKQIFSPSLFVQKEGAKVEMTERLLSDHGFLSVLNERYPNFHCEVDEYGDGILVTRLA